MCNDERTIKKISNVTLNFRLLDTKIRTENVIKSLFILSGEVTPGYVERHRPYEWIHASVALFGIINARENRLGGCLSRTIAELVSSTRDAIYLIVVII